MKNSKYNIYYILGAVLLLTGVIIVLSLIITNKTSNPTTVTLQDIYKKISTLEWSDIQGEKSWNNAILVCSALGPGWRLPTFLELTTALATSFTDGGPGLPGGFMKDNGGYWSNVESDSENAFLSAIAFYGEYIYIIDNKASENYVRCVR
jgi:hypothetical protein